MMNGMFNLEIEYDQLLIDVVGGGTYHSTNCVHD